MHGAETSETYLKSIEEWGPNLTILALDAIDDAYNDALRGDTDTGLHGFFREKKYQPNVLERFDIEIEKRKRLADREKEDLDDKLRLPKLTKAE